MGALTGKRIVLGVTGGIAAYKAVEVCRRLVEAGAHVQPVMTDGALEMVGATTFSALASEPVKTSLFDDPETPIPHTRMGQAADLVLVCPATARIISDIRTGRSADLLMSTILATRAPVVVCPAMHTEMWEQPAVQENLDVIERRGVSIVPPERGRLAGGDTGDGRLADPATVVAHVERALTEHDLAGRHVLVTAGGTREPIDPVRVISNKSTGKQGYAVAAEAWARGARVTLVTTVETPEPVGVHRVDVQTAADMQRAVESIDDADIIVMAAAVADFRPADPADHKLKKTDGAAPEIPLEKTHDFLVDLGEKKPDGQVLIGFAAETDDLVGNARAKLERKKLDLIVANDVSQPGVGFGYDTNEVVIIQADGSCEHVPLTDKRDVARRVLDTAANKLG
ncbi:MAG: bifunctional phosphopantothenoylcysteine decarboxylase/phosphopantothenate--cysteine ligase CoaBC [Acidimicrobiales bacterium]